MKIIKEKKITEIEVTKFESFDGERFDTKKECEVHEAQLDVEHKFLKLNKTPLDMVFSSLSNGDEDLYAVEVKDEKDIRLVETYCQWNIGSFADGEIVMPKEFPCYVSVEIDECWYFIHPLSDIKKRVEKLYHLVNGLE